jgi:hypothetical protein
MKKMTKSVLMTNAWKIAKEGAAKFGGSPKDYIAESMKKAWAIKREFEGTQEKKAAQKKEFKNLKGMATSKQIWFIEKLLKELEAKLSEKEFSIVLRQNGHILEEGTYGTTKQEASEAISELLEMKNA